MMDDYKKLSRAKGPGGAETDRGGVVVISPLPNFTNFLKSGIGQHAPDEWMGTGVVNSTKKSHLNFHIFKFN